MFKMEKDGSTVQYIRRTILTNLAIISMLVIVYTVI